MTTEYGIRYRHPITDAPIERFGEGATSVRLPTPFGAPERFVPVDDPRALHQAIAEARAADSTFVAIGLEAVQREQRVSPLPPPLPRTPGSVIEATLDGGPRTRLVLVAPRDSHAWLAVPRAAWATEDSLSEVVVLWEAPEP